MQKRRAFTLVELLVVIGIMSVLVGLFIPALGKARASAQRALCASNLRQIYLASMTYATDNRGYLPPAHYNFMKNLQRWHGVRGTLSQPFDFAGSPLKKYLQTAAIKQCPSLDPVAGGFEASAGGYGYNNRFLGSSTDEAIGFAGGYLLFDSNFGNIPAKVSMIQQPMATIMFTDAAIAQPDLIEYSFVEAPLTKEGYPTSPSIHFRHKGFANVIWVDGHLTSQAMEWTYPVNVYGADNAQNHLGFFGPRDNTLFDRH